MSWFKKLSGGLRKTSDAIGGVFTARTLDKATLEALEDQLILADMGAVTAAAIVAELAKNRINREVGSEEIRTLLAESIARRLAPYAVPLATQSGGEAPYVALVVGVNGNGKTTTIGKMAHQLTQEGKRVVLVAADTFRAAAVEQLEHWSARAGCGFVRGAENADPASVVYAGLEQAIAQHADVVFIDTAGRLHTKENLMAELAKMTKVIKKLLPDAPHAVLQVLDATTGQNALAQVKAFGQVAGVTGLVVTKLDGTAKAGIVVALAEQFKLPIHAIGVGEGAEDLQPFAAEDFARALVGL
ncbi:MAG: signal recognition particle-docking protein FtsY [Alphaproteobacteria bacterium]|nr:signal recognition particle-docking protein FtsY [Alphaproteobacteria bacterium]